MDSGVIPHDSGPMGFPDAYVPPRDSGGARDAYVAPRDTGTVRRDSGGGGGTCITGCTADSQCAGSCPPNPSGGANCCDVSTGTCYAATTASCPAGMGSDSGTGY